MSVIQSKEKSNLDICFEQTGGGNLYLAQNLKYLRERNGKLQKDMCELLGVTEATMSKYESGYIKPDIKKLITLADHFGVTLDQMVKQDLSKEK